MPQYIRIILILCSATFTQLSYSAEQTTNAKEKPPLKIVAVNNNIPFSFTLPTGKQTGLYVELWKLWSEVNNYPVDIQIISFDQSIDAVKDQQAVHIGLFINDERNKWADFSIPFHSVKTSVIFNQNFSPNTKLADLKDITVAVQKGSFQDAFLRQNYPDIKRQTYNSSQVVVNKLLTNEVQGIVGEVPYLNSQISRMGLTGVFLSNEELTSNTVHMAVPKGRQDLLELINTGINKIPVDAIIQLEKKWLPNQTPYFSDKVSFKYLNTFEQQWLSSNSKLSLGIEKHWPPFEFLNSNNELSGIIGDYSKHVSEVLGLQLTIASQYSWSESLNLLKEGKIDMMAGVARTPERESQMLFSEPYITMPTVIVNRKNSFFASSLDSLNGRTLALIEGYVYNDLIKRDFPEINIVSVASIEEGLERVNTGEVDAYMGAIAAINQLIERKRLTNLIIAAFTPYSIETSMGFRNGLEPLVDIVNKVILTMSEKEKQKIANTWLSVHVNQGWSLVTILTWSIPILIILTGIILLVTYSNRRMKAEISERIKAEHKLIEATELAKHANQAKSDFLANMSHEIRTPMNAVIGVCNLLIDGGLSKKQRKKINIILSSSDSLLLLINDILDLSKIEAGKLTLEQRDYKLQTVLQQINAQITLLMNNRNVEFRIQVDEDVPTYLNGDRLRLGQILLNLCNNAIKFTNKGHIELRIKKVHQNRSTYRIRIEIKDTGIGMSKSQQEKLFETYTQADASITRRYGGTGLGLTITKHLVNLMNGKIWVESEVDKGSTFFVEIDQKHASKILPDELTHGDKTSDSFGSYPELADKKVLIVDDNKVNLMVTRKLLCKFNMKVVTVENGQQAVDIVLVQDFDIVLMDLQMPIMDGYTATTEIRKQTKNEHLPIIALSANVMQSDIDRCYQVGINSHLPKPLNIEQICETMSRYIGK